MNRKFISLFFLFFMNTAGFQPANFVCNTQEPMSIETGHAAYKDSILVLQNNVQLKHSIGTLQSDEAEIVPHPDEKKIEKGTVNLKGHVNISLKDGGTLSCGKACLDFHANTGIFEGDQTLPEVIYLENFKGKSTTSIPLVLKSKKMSVDITKDTEISKIIAENDVFIDYNHDFVARADMASYHREKSQEMTSKAFLSGLIHLKRFEEEGVCQITNKNGDLIRAKNICLNTVTKEIACSYPKGIFMANRPSSNGEPIDFHADKLTWEEEHQRLSLKDNVKLEQKGFFQLRNKDEIKITHASTNQKKQIEKIYSQGKTDLTGYEENKEHHLTCYGKTTVDHANLWVYMESPLDEQGKVIEDQQVFFEDGLGQIYADKLAFQYQMENKSIVPKKIILEGHVKMLNSYAAGPDPTSPLIRYALADKVEYDLNSKEALFSSFDNSKRVLLYDKANDLEISAIKLKIIRDETTKKEKIQGVGDVRFSFIENEFEQLRQHFALDKFKDKQKNDKK